ncbi:dethiobiotin synthetase [Tamilnaduibacter salinus]|uniref:ATP-dependent dethiobiotin synthetase BioD n=1 Tax=Tamilnaduibacter salinus TaxID=1484056 RepID=A0A2U1CUK1_9GAMM|nr:dethiobiotin synthase [Tamilnaduibacter salinus]PVY70720.1 dethiobiotin synthetase [Tamilnaduibacter salinus]
MTRKTYFVTGTDTGVGKSVVTAAILEAANRQGLRTLAMKPIASGSEETADGLRNEDALLLQKHMSESLDYDLVNPIAMAPAIAPHVAAGQAGRQLSAQRLTGLCRGLQTRPGDLLLIEGAGGWRVPLNERETFAQVPGALGVPVILVVSLKLGCINHALLTAEAILRDGLTLAGWVANRTEETPMAVEAENLDYLRSHLPAPCLGELPWAPDANPVSLADYLDLSPLVEN